MMPFQAAIQVTVLPQKMFGKLDLLYASGIFLATSPLIIVRFSKFKNSLVAENLASGLTLCYSIICVYALGAFEYLTARLGEKSLVYSPTNYPVSRSFLTVVY